MTPRPRSLKEVADRSKSIEDFGRNLRDWLHELRRLSSRLQVSATIEEKPVLLRSAFPEGNIADAWLAAYAEYAASKLGIRPPDWAFTPSRVAVYPAFDEGGENPRLRVLALLQSPLAFKRRNIYTTSVDLPLRIHQGRPRKSTEEKRQANAERQRRFRNSRKAELKALRALARRQSHR